MSAYVVSEAHIHFLVQAALAGPCDGVGWNTDAERGLSWHHDGRLHRLVRTAGICERRSTALPECDAIELVSASLLGQLLLDACVASVRSRYRGASSDACELLKARDAWYEEPYIWQPCLQGDTEPAVPGRPTIIPPPATTVVIAKQVAHYEYQCDDHDGWEQSQARAFCGALSDALLRSLPGWDSAPWGIDNGSRA